MDVDGVTRGRNRTWLLFQLDASNYPFHSLPFISPASFRVTIEMIYASAFNNYRYLRFNIQIVTVANLLSDCQ